MFYDAVLTNIKKNPFPKALKLQNQENGKIGGRFPVKRRSVPKANRKFVIQRLAFGTLQSHYLPAENTNPNCRQSQWFWLVLHQVPAEYLLRKPDLR